MMLILHFIFICITRSFLPRQLFMSFCFFVIESAIPSNLYFKSMCAIPEFSKGTSMSSTVHKYNIIIQFMIFLILSVKAQFSRARGFTSHSSRKLVCNFFLSTILRLLWDNSWWWKFSFFDPYLYVVISRLYSAVNCSIFLIQEEPLPLLIFCSSVSVPDNILLSWFLSYRKYSTILIFISICNG